MEKWELALLEFMKDWEDEPYVTGALVCGSYITGNPSAHSDIDIHIILSKDTKWRERGNKIINGILIEYFANPFELHQQYENNDYNERKKINAHMFATGKILFDKTGEITELKSRGKETLKKEFNRSNPFENELMKYSIWDLRDNLEELFERKSDDFYIAFYHALYSLFDDYSKYLGFDYIPPTKIERFLFDRKDKKKYMVSEHPDKEFVLNFRETMKLQDKELMMKKISVLIDMVLNKMNGFNIDGWKIKGEI